MKLTATKRTETGTSASKRARAEGKIPAAIYGREVETVPVLLNEKELEMTLREVGSNGVFKVDVDGETYDVFVKDKKNAALKPEIYHVDLLAFTKGQKVNMTIPVYVNGEEEIKEGIVSQSISELEVNVAPANAPSEYIVDVSEMEIGDAKHVSDIVIADDVELLTDTELTVVSVSAPQIEEEPEPTSDDEMPEPEVIGEDKDSE
ncbi:MAG: 50S ribosomal protein L25 [Alkalibacterium sp.]|uniref:Large ribosomal subunit protein bL25 n=1 Tax=Alkalibacterium gilvum TaxID=1130080 RepID=A0A1H6SUK8_9LACT|nr:MULTISPECIES: 50S ribosomal protein L25 [Alkalibacterium]MDN6293362.1 50S ribosomal protein L25 [Alkalibacterium sp.]MDN6295830.1 50S ribosomal protein L25 [Alkalibacterium sp.]MDN6327421.1 50S ribosomal protein L25 [Alkalibacterium sp.]MDN6397444.1 50S ribosomal protein L25 [Alkalibacterium sp.]SEI69464.1 large subunit ribosomal protein L25 [Alkalibacterium gilvum]